MLSSDVDITLDRLLAAVAEAHILLTMLNEELASASQRLAQLETATELIMSDLDCIYASSRPVGA